MATSSPFFAACLRDPWREARTHELRVPDGAASWRRALDWLRGYEETAEPRIFEDIDLLELFEHLGNLKKSRETMRKYMMSEMQERLLMRLSRLEWMEAALELHERLDMRKSSFLPPRQSFREVHGRLWAGGHLLHLVEAWCQQGGTAE